MKKVFFLACFLISLHLILSGSVYAANNGKEENPDLDIVLKSLQEIGVSPQQLNLDTLLVLNDSDDRVGIITENPQINQYSQYAINLNNGKILFIATFKLEEDGDVTLTVRDPLGEIIFTKEL